MLPHLDRSLLASHSQAWCCNWPRDLALGGTCMTVTGHIWFDACISWVERGERGSCTVWCCNLASRSRFCLCCCAISHTDHDVWGVKACETHCCWLAVPEKLEVRVPGDLVKVEGDGYNLNRNEVDNGSKEFEKHTGDNCLLILRPLQGVELPTGSFHLVDGEVSFSASWVAWSCKQLDYRNSNSLWSSRCILVEELGSWVLKGGGNAKDFGPHSGPCREELDMSTVGVVAEYLEHYQTCQWPDINIKQKDGYVHNELQVRQQFLNVLVKQLQNFLNASESWPWLWLLCVMQFQGEFSRACGPSSSVKLLICKCDNHKQERWKKLCSNLYLYSKSG